MLAIPMDAEGVEVRPLRQMTGECEFNEVFLDDVVVPIENLIGPEHGGWRVANTTLANERGASFIWREQVLCRARHSSRSCTPRPAMEAMRDPRVRQALARSWIDVELFRLHNGGTLGRLARGEQIGSESSIVKLFWAGVEPAPRRDGGCRARSRRAAHARRRRRRRRRTVGAGAVVDACQLDHGRHERDPAQHRRRADSRPSEGAAIDDRAR